MVQTPPPVGGTMGFQEAVRKVLNNYVNFQGRASRAEYWWWALFTFIIGVIFGALEVTGLKIFAILGGIVNLALLLPGLGVLWRRLHDMGRADGLSSRLFPSWALSFSSTGSFSRANSSPTALVMFP